MNSVLCQLLEPLHMYVLWVLLIVAAKMEERGVSRKLTAVQLLHGAVDGE